MSTNSRVSRSILGHRRCCFRSSSMCRIPGWQTGRCGTTATTRERTRSETNKQLAGPLVGLQLLCIPHNLLYSPGELCDDASRWEKGVRRTLGVLGRVLLRVLGLVARSWSVGEVKSKTTEEQGRRGLRSIQSFGCQVLMIAEVIWQV